MQQSVVSRAPIGACKCNRRRLPSSGHRVLVPLALALGGRQISIGKSTGRLHDHPNSLLPTAVNTDQNKHNSIHEIREDKFFQVEMIVHDDDLDEYGVVNNGIYARYIHDARNALLETLGIDVHFWASTGNVMALSELHLNYFAPLMSGGRFVVKLRVVQIKGVRIIIDHLIETLPNHKLVMEATATAVCLDKNYRPTRVFPELVSKIHMFFSHMDAST